MLENRLDKELATSQSMETKKLCSGQGRYCNYKQPFGQKASGFEKALGSLLQQFSEQFMAGSREYEAALTRRMEVENVWVKHIVTHLVSMVKGMAEEFRQIKRGEDQCVLVGGHHKEGGGDEG